MNDKTNEDVDISDLEEHFQKFLNEPWPKGCITDRQKLWVAFKAGGEWAIQEVRKNAKLPETQTALKGSP